MTDADQPYRTERPHVGAEPYPPASAGPVPPTPQGRPQQPSAPQVDPPAAAAAPAGATRAAGWAGVVLLYALTVVQLVLPSARTVATSLTGGSFLTGPEPVGVDGYAQVLPQLASAVVLVLVVTLPVALLASLLGAVIGTAMTASQRLSPVVRVLVGVTGAFFVPVGVGLARMRPGEVDLGSPGSAVAFLAVTLTLGLLPLLTAVVATVVALTRGGRGGVGVVVALVMLTGPALALQLFDLPYLLLGGGPGGSTRTPTGLAVERGFAMLDLGGGSAVGSMTLLALGVLGLVAVALLAGTGVRLVPDGPAAPGPRTAGVVGLVVAVLVLVVALVVTVPVLVSGIGADLPEGLSGGAVVAATWSPAAAGAAVQVLVALLGGAAIGWCRPAGARSLWLLLPLAPWLFVGPGPLVLARFEAARDAGTVNTWSALVPPPLVVAAVVVLALLFTGMRERVGRGGVGTVAAVAAGTFGVLLLVQAQALLPALAVVNDPELRTAPLALSQLVRQLAATEAPLWLLYPLPLLVVVAALGVVFQLGTRRLVLVRG